MLRFLYIQFKNVLNKALITVIGSESVNLEMGPSQVRCAFAQPWAQVERLRQWPKLDVRNIDPTQDEAFNPN
jgi:hypothetical protein